MHEVNFTIQPGNQAAATISNSVDRRMFPNAPCAIAKAIAQGASQSSSGACVTPA
jgi:hypothetical protein